MSQKQTATAPAVGKSPAVNPPDLQHLYSEMQRIRRFEEVIGDAAIAGEFKGPTHLYIGQEAVAVGVCAGLRRIDLVFGGHRSHGHYLAKGGDMSRLAAEILVRETGCSRGRGGSMHLTAPEVGVLGTSALVGGGMGTGVGSALASVRLRLDRVTVIFFGDGAIEEGVFHEALNCASLYGLPVVFICENNLYASHMPLHLRQHRSEIYEHAIPYGMPGLRIDGNDVLEVRKAASVAVARAQGGEGPTLIECMTYRWRGHVGPSWDRETQIRPEAEIEAWIDRCPIKRHRQLMFEVGGTDAARIAELDAKVEAEVEEAMAFARRSPFPKVEELLNFVYQD